MSKTIGLARVLSQVPLFASLPPPEIETLVDGSHLRNVAPGELVVSEGFHNDSLCVLLEGEVEIIKALDTNDERRLAILGQGAFLGEMGLFNSDGLHTASARASTHATVLELPREDLYQLLLRFPTMSLEVISTLTGRLKQSDNLTIIDLRDKNRLLGQAYKDLKEAQDQIIRQERLERELELARGIQASLLPTRLPVLDGYSFASTMMPASAVGGDFFDFIARPDGRLGIGVGDVSDHGIPSALMMAQSMTLLRVEARYEAAPHETLAAMNQEMLARDNMGMFLTVLYGLLDPDSGVFEFARAGHNPPLLLDPSGRAEEVKHGPGQPLGLIENPELDLGQVELKPGSLMLLYTDGVTETVNEDGEMFGVERVLDLLEKAGTETSAEEICQSLHASLIAFRGPLPQSDDITTLALRATRPS